MDLPGTRRTLSRGDELWRIERDGTVVRTARGRPGRPARTTVRVCGSLRAAERWYAREIQTRLDRDYHQSSAPPGWPTACHPPEAVHTPLELRVRREPWNDALADEYSAWLVDQHDPRGALAALQHRSTPPSADAARAARRFAWLLGAARDDALPPSWGWRGPKSPTGVSTDLRASRAQAEHALLESHRRHFFGGLRDFEDRLAFTWHRGFLDTITLAAGEAQYDDETPSDGALLRRALRLRSARLLRGLCIALPEFDDDYDGLPEVLDGVLDGPARGLLSFSCGREVWYDDESDDEFHDIDTAREAAPVLGSLARLGASFPRLEHLELVGRELDLGDWHLPHLRHVELHFACPEEPAVASFARAAWPALRSLRLGLGDFPGPAAEADALAVLGPILTCERMPQLRHLALVHPPDADAVCAVLARVPAAARLETLEISSSGLTGLGARELAAARPRFTNLRRLNLAGNYLGAADERRLRRAFAGVQIHAGPQRTPVPRDLDDDEWGEELQLAALGGAPAVPSGLLRSDDDLPDHLDDRFELLLDRIVVDPPTSQDDARLRPADEVPEVAPAPATEET